MVENYQLSPEISVSLQEFYLAIFIRPISPIALVDCEGLTLVGGLIGIVQLPEFCPL